MTNPIKIEIWSMDGKSQNEILTKAAKAENLNNVWLQSCASRWKERYQIVNVSSCMDFILFSSNDLNYWKRLLKTLGLTYKKISTQNGVTRYAVDQKVIERYFWKQDQIPSTATNFYHAVNGHMVKCYMTHTDKEVVLYFPNPNAKEVYKPLSTARHIKLAALKEKPYGYHKWIKNYSNKF